MESVEYKGFKIYCEKNIYRISCLNSNKLWLKDLKSLIECKQRINKAIIRLKRLKMTNEDKKLILNIFKNL